MAGHSRPKRPLGRGWSEPGAARGVLWRREPPLARQLAQGAARVLSSQLRPTAPYLPYISPTTPLGELLPTAVRANGAATAFGVHWLCNIVIGNYFLLASQRFGVAACYSLFGGVALVGAAFCASQVPETKGRSLEEIEAKYAPASAAD